MKIFLVGYMGCGKSTIGREVARRLGVRFADMDKEVEKECQMTIGDIFARHGEAYFRNKESEVLVRLCGEENIVVATGGGVPCFDDNMEIMKQAGCTVYLKMTPEKLLGRLENGRAKRPLIRDLDNQQLLAFIGENLAKREPFYAQAGMVIDCDGVSDEYVTNHIVLYTEIK